MIQLYVILGPSKGFHKITDYKILLINIMIVSPTTHIGIQANVAAQNPSTM